MSRPTVIQREAIIALELSDQGYQEQPPGSNNTIFGEFMGTNHLAWCAAFQSYCHDQITGLPSIFPATSNKGSASCYAIQQWAIRQGCWVDGDQAPERGDLVIYGWTSSWPDHIGKVLSGSVRDIMAVEGNTSDTVAIRHRMGRAILGYVRFNWAADPTVVTPEPGQNVIGKVDLGDPPAVAFTNDPSHSDPTVIRYMQRALNAILPMWGERFNTPVDGIFGPATQMGLAAFKRGANDKQWQGEHGHVAVRMFIDPNDSRIGPKTLQYGRFFAMLG